MKDFSYTDLDVMIIKQCMKPTVYTLLVRGFHTEFGYLQGATYFQMFNSLDFCLLQLLINFSFMSQFTLPTESCRLWQYRFYFHSR